MARTIRKPPSQGRAVVMRVHKMTNYLSGSFEPFHNRDLRANKSMRATRKNIADRIRKYRKQVLGR